MPETVDQPVSQEAQAESPIAGKFASARDRIMQEAEEIGEIYRSIEHPGIKDVYNSWVKNMDVVANSFATDKNKHRLKTLVVKGLNRIVGAGAVMWTVPLDLVIDTFTWLPRKVPVIKYIIPHDIFKKHTIRMSESAKRDYIISKGAYKVAEVQRKFLDVQGRIVGGAIKRAVVGPMGIPETRAAWEYAKRKASNISEAILHPKPKAA